MAAQGDDAGGPTDLTHLSLEDLYDLEIVQINVLGGHTHPAGQIMVGYDFSYMEVGGYRKNSRSVSDSSVLKKGFANIHTKMKMEMHMAQVMYAPSDRLTLMAMLPYYRMSMDHEEADGGRFTTRSEGFGDVGLLGLYTVWGDIREAGQRLLLTGGLSVPTGSINQKYTVEGRRGLVEYKMQLGSGTYDLLPGLTYLNDSEHWSIGVRASSTVRLGRNSKGYRFGTKYELTGWAAYALRDWFSPHLRLDGRYWGNVHGSDSRLNPLSNPESDPDLQGGRRLDLLLGMNFYAPRGSLRGNRLTIEAGLPVYEYLKGPQLSTKWRLTAGWSRTF